MFCCTLVARHWKIYHVQYSFHLWRHCTQLPYSRTSQRLATFVACDHQRSKHLHMWIHQHHRIDKLHQSIRATLYLYLYAKYVESIWSTWKHRHECNQRRRRHLQLAERYYTVHQQQRGLIQICSYYRFHHCQQQQYHSKARFYHLQKLFKRWYRHVHPCSFFSTIGQLSYKRSKGSIAHYLHRQLQYWRYGTKRRKLEHIQQHIYHQATRRHYLIQWRKRCQQIRQVRPKQHDLLHILCRLVIKRSLRRNRSKLHRKRMIGYSIWVKKHLHHWWRYSQASIANKINQQRAQLRYQTCGMSDSLCRWHGIAKQEAKLRRCYRAYVHVKQHPLQLGGSKHDTTPNYLMQSAMFTHWKTVYLPRQRSQLNVIRYLHQRHVRRLLARCYQLWFECYESRSIRRSQLQQALSQWRYCARTWKRSRRRLVPSRVASSPGHAVRYPIQPHLAHCLHRTLIKWHHLVQYQHKVARSISYHRSQVDVELKHHFQLLTQSQQHHLRHVLHHYYTLWIARIKSRKHRFHQIRINKTGRKYWKKWVIAYNCIAMRRCLRILPIGNNDGDGDGDGDEQQQSRHADSMIDGSSTPLMSAGRYYRQHASSYGYSHGCSRLIGDLSYATIYHHAPLPATARASARKENTTPNRILRSVDTPNGQITRGYLREYAQRRGYQQVQNRSVGKLAKDD